MQLPKRSITLALVGIFAFSPLPVAAHEGDDSGRHHESQTQQMAQTEVRQKVDAKRQELKQKLDDKKRQVCATREASINKHTQHIVDMRKQQIAHIGSIVDRTKAFYVKSGKQLATYNTLVATVDAKRQAADAGVSAVQAKAAFSCNSDAPKAALQEFKAARDQLLAAIRDYRKAAKDLIVGVKSAQGTTAKEVQ